MLSKFVCTIIIYSPATSQQTAFCEPDIQYLLTCVSSVIFWNKVECQNKELGHQHKDTGHVFKEMGPQDEEQGHLEEELGPQDEEPGLWEVAG